MSSLMTYLPHDKNINHVQFHLQDSIKQNEESTSCAADKFICH